MTQFKPDNDYLIIGVDPQKQIAIRFLSLTKTTLAEINKHNITESWQPLFADLLLGSVILSSRQDDQQTILFKLKLDHSPIQINVEVNSRGHLRTAFIRNQNQSTDVVPDKINGILKVVVLNQNNQTYESVIPLVQNSLRYSFEHYLKQSVQTDSIFCLHRSLQQQDNALWIERLPQTKEEFWKTLTQNITQNRFEEILNQNTDPDIILKELLGFELTILAVTHPQAVCSCTRERLLKALHTLSREELMDMFMDGKGIESTCDYCKTVWKIEDAEIKDLLGITTAVQ